MFAECSLFKAGDHVTCGDLQQNSFHSIPLSVSCRLMKQHHGSLKPTLTFCMINMSILINIST